jgi:erythromycin esterase-like protein
MTTSIRGSATHVLASSVRPLTGAPADFDDVLALAGHRQFCLIGEASHGTHEFYRIRAEITKRLIAEHGFTAVAVEADWPDAYRVNRYVRGGGSDGDAEASLRGFQRFPQWMWRNADVLDFVGWLRAFNEAHPTRQAGFYGLDLYSLHASVEAVLGYLRKVDPDAAARAARRYACFDHFSGDPQEYGYQTSMNPPLSCEREVVAQLVDLRERAADYIGRNGRVSPDDLFFAEQNARLVVNAERYYRTMYAGGAASWNLRDQHMATTLGTLTTYLETHQPGTKIVVWAHNSHLGDARATEVARRGELNLGQLVRESVGDGALLVGFTTFDGTVTAVSNWDAPMERKRVRPALPGSYELMFHELGFPRLFMDLRRGSEAYEYLEATPRLERAIGVIYRPETERLSHYFRARLAPQFDAVFHYDRTRAVEPLDRTAHWERGEPELPETFPSAL